MGLTIETWSIAYRKKKDNFLKDNSEFTLIKNGHKGWYADPFLFEYKGELFLFSEFYSYRLCKGVISFAKYDKSKDKFSKFRVVLSEDYHLSYPLIFEYNNVIYMLPESNESNSLVLYRAVDFPDKWEKVSIMMNNIRLVDTTPFIYNNQMYALTMRLDDYNPENDKKMLLLKINTDLWKVEDYAIVSDDIKIARPGGKIFLDNDNLVAVTQDCYEEYGRALNFISCKFYDEMSLSLLPIRKVFPNKDYIDVDEIPSGLHTYNFCSNIEVVDFKFYKKSFYRLALKALKKIFH